MCDTDDDVQTLFSGEVKKLALIMGKTVNGLKNRGQFGEEAEVAAVSR